LGPHNLAQSNQPDVNYQMATLVALISSSFTPAVTSILFGTSDWHVRITTFSSSGDYRYQSDNSLDTLQKVAAKTMTRAEWEAAAKAAFR
jgi:hypothetical protein